MNHHVFDDPIALLWTLKNMPHILRHSLESLLKSLRLILLLDPNSCDIRDFANKNEVDPAWEFIISEYNLG